MTLIAKLGAGDNPSSDYINLANLARPGIAIQVNGFKIATPQLKTQYVAGPARDGADPVESHYENPQESFPLDIEGSDAAGVAQLIQALNNYLQRANAYARTGEGTPIVLTIQPEGSMTMYYLDVLEGTLTLPDTAIDDTVISATVTGATLNFTRRPFARLDPVSGALGATVGNTGAAVVNITGVPGDVAAPLQLTAEDHSSAGAINELLVGVRTARQGGTPSNKVWVKGLSLAGTSVSQSEADSLNGSTVVRATPDTDYADAATTTMTTNLTENSGLMRVLLRFRDNSGLPAPAYLSALLRNRGSLAVGTHYYALSAKLGTGITLPTSWVAVATTSNLKSVNLGWALQAGATGYRLFHKFGSAGTVQYHDYSSGVRGVTDTGGISWTTGSPPDASTAVSPLAVLKLRYGFVNDPSDNMYETREVIPGVAGQFVLVDFGLIRLSPARVAAGYVDPGWKLIVQSRINTSVLSGTVDFDAVYLLPYEGRTASAWYGPRTLATPGTFVLDQSTDEQLRAVLVSSGAVLGALKADGRLYVEPGNNTVFATATQASRVHNIHDTALKLGYRYVPRVLHIA